MAAGRAAFFIRILAGSGWETTSVLVVAAAFQFTWRGAAFVAFIIFSVHIRAAGVA